MRKTTIFAGFTLTAAGLIFLLSGVLAQSTFEVLKGEAFDRSVPAHFYLEGQAIPIQKRNAALVKGSGGVRCLAGLLDTSGYGTDITQKYEGMILLEGELTLGGQAMTTGAYGFGVKRPIPPATGPATVPVYDIAGVKVSELSADRDDELQGPRPLQFIVERGGARLYLGRYWLELK
jgi:hypothetical protein